MAEHSMLSASGASKWLNCTPSAVLESQFDEKPSSYADEGTLAHRLSEAYLKLYFRQKTKQWFKKEIIEIKKSQYYDESMEEYVDQYVTYVMETYNTYGKNSIIFIEQTLDLSKYIPEGQGTNDVMIFSQNVLEIIDLKYGRGVPVYAEKNKQMMLYAVGSIEKFGFIYDIDIVRMSIYQPRIGNYSSWDINAEELIIWAEQEVKPKAELAFKGLGEFVAGQHCLFCKAKPMCRANMDYQLELAKLDFKKPDLMSDEEVSFVLERQKLFIDWVGSVAEYALEQAAKHNKKWPGVKLVEGRSNRKYLDDEKVVKRLTDAGWKLDDISTRKLLGIVAMEKLLGKITFQDILTDLLVKPQGSPALVSVKDKRPELNSIEQAKEDFK